MEPQSPAAVASCPRSPFRLAPRGCPGPPASGSDQGSDIRISLRLNPVHGGIGPGDGPWAHPGREGSGRWRGSGAGGGEPASGAAGEGAEPAAGNRQVGQQAKGGSGEGRVRRREGQRARCAQQRFRGNASETHPPTAQRAARSKPRLRRLNGEAPPAKRLERSANREAPTEKGLIGGGASLSEPRPTTPRKAPVPRELAPGSSPSAPTTDTGCGPRGRTPHRGGAAERQARPAPEDASRARDGAPTGEPPSIGYGFAPLPRRAPS